MLLIFHWKSNEITRNGEFGIMVKEGDEIVFTAINYAVDGG